MLFEILVCKKFIFIYGLYSSNSIIVTEKRLFNILFSYRLVFEILINNFSYYIYNTTINLFY